MIDFLGRKTEGEEHMEGVIRIPWDSGRSYPVIALSRWHGESLGAVFGRHACEGMSLKDQPGYRDAKHRGDIRAARRIVETFLTKGVLEEIKTLTEGTDALVVAPCTMSKGQHNVLPISMAHHVAHHLGLTVNKQIFQRKGPHRTGQDGIERLFNHPGFYGAVHKGRSYLIVDDVLTLGGTAADIRSHIEANGGKVLGTVVLSHSPSRNAMDCDKVQSLRSGAEVADMAISPAAVGKLTKKFGTILTTLCRKAFGNGPECFTAQEGGFIARFSSLDSVLDRAPS